MAVVDERFLLRHQRLGSPSRRAKSPGKRRPALHKSVKNETELHIPRAFLWKRGDVMIRGAYTGIPLLAVNYETGFQNHLQPKKWVGKNTLALISEVDPGTGRVGRVVGMIRREGAKGKDPIYLYTYFPSFDGQTPSFKDMEFCQNTMYRYGEFVPGRLGRPKHSFARAVGITRDGQARMKIICEVRTDDLSFNPMKRLIRICKSPTNLELSDPQTGQAYFRRDQTTEITTIEQGQNMIVGVCLSYIMDLIANPREEEF